MRVRRVSALVVGAIAALASLWSAGSLAQDGTCLVWRCGWCFQQEIIAPTAEQYAELYLRAFVASRQPYQLECIKGGAGGFTVIPSRSGPPEVVSSQHRLWADIYFEYDLQACPDLPAGEQMVPRSDAGVGYRTSDCPAEGSTQCDGSITGQRFTRTYQYGGSAPGSYCDTDSMCRVRRSGLDVCLGDPGQCVASYIGTEETCGGDGVMGTPSRDRGEDCVVGPSGLSLCAGPAMRPGCGYLDGEYVCVEATQPDRCIETESGRMLCADDAPMPPRPDDGTPGVPAPPDDEMAVVDQTREPPVVERVQIYDPSTVGNSSRPAGDGSDPWADQVGGRGGGSAESDQDGGGLTCDPSSDQHCDGDGAAGEGDDPRSGWQCWADGEGLASSVAGCFAAAAQGAWTQLHSESALISAVTAIAGAWPESVGSCPSAVVTLLGETFDFWAVPCEMLAYVEPVLSPLFLLLWSVLGLRILLTIPGGNE